MDLSDGIQHNTGGHHVQIGLQQWQLLFLEITVDFIHVTPAEIEPTNCP
jgi:hypothetical protein